MQKRKTVLAVAAVMAAAALASPAFAYEDYYDGGSDIDNSNYNSNFAGGGDANANHNGNNNGNFNGNNGNNGHNGNNGNFNGNNGNNGHNGNNGNNNSSSSNHQGQAQGQAQGQLQGQGQGQAQSADNSNSNNASQDVNVNTHHQRAPVSTAFAAPLVAGEDTCMGSSSAGAQGISFGLSFGTTWRDRNCMRLKNSRQLVSLGYPRAATALMCQDRYVREAMEEAGTPCPSGPELVAYVAPAPVVEAAPVAAPPPVVVAAPPPAPRARPRQETPEDWEKVRRSK